MKINELLAAFDEQLRRDARPEISGAVIERDGSVVRQVAPAGGWDGVLWSDLDEAGADAAIRAQIRRFAALRRDFEWKHYAHDRPVDLGARLLASGFTAEPPETVLVAEISTLPTEIVLPEGVTLRTVTDASGADLVAEVHDLAFGTGGDQIRGRVLAELAASPGTVAAVVAMAGAVPVSAARMELHEGTDFASLWGGGTIEAWRGRGIYRALVAYRTRIAADRGFRYLQVDASEDSRPILQRLGFVAISVTTPYVYAVSADAADTEDARDAKESDEVDVSEDADVKEESLSGGVNTVTRIGRTVHRPTGPWTPAVHALLDHLARAGFAGAPRVHGIDDQGREILDYIDGWVGDPLPEDARGDDTLRAVGRLLRGMHDATLGFITPPNATWYFPPRKPVEVICHGDTANYNIAFRGGEPVAFIDFDTAHPGPRVWDVAYTAFRFAPMADPDGPDPDGDAFTLPLPEQAHRLRLLADAYGLSGADRRTLPDTAVERLRHLVAHMREQAAGGNEAFASHIAQGHDAYYLACIAYIGRHRAVYLAALE